MPPPFLKSSMNKILATIITLGSIVGGWMVFEAYLDGKYVHADTYAQDQHLIVDQLRQNERNRLDAEVFKLNNIPPQARTEFDNAQLEQFRTQIQRLDAATPPPSRNIQ